MTQADPRDLQPAATEASLRSREVREQWAADIAEGVVSLMEAVTYSGSDAKYVRKIPLISILRKMEGWTVHTAKNALVSSGIAVNTKLGRLARSRSEMADFEDILRGSFQRWIPNINYPDKYPFFGKIEDVLAQTDVSAFMPEPEEGQSRNSQGRFAAAGAEGQIDAGIDDGFGIDDETNNALGPEDADDGDVGDEIDAADLADEEPDESEAEDDAAAAALANLIGDLNLDE